MSVTSLSTEDIISFCCSVLEKSLGAIKKKKDGNGVGVPGGFCSLYVHAERAVSRGEAPKHRNASLMGAATAWHPWNAYQWIIW